MESGKLLCHPCTRLGSASSFSEIVKTVSSQSSQKKNEMGTVTVGVPESVQAASVSHPLDSVDDRKLAAQETLKETTGQETGGFENNDAPPSIRDRRCPVTLPAIPMEERTHKTDQRRQDHNNNLHTDSKLVLAGEEGVPIDMDEQNACCIHCLAAFVDVAGIFNRSRPQLEIAVFDCVSSANETCS